jgi:hypothetical protein
LGNNTYTGAPSTTAFEPLDSFKGDIARTYFYMTTRYYSEDADWQTWEMAAKAELSQWAINMLLDWHHKDPVSKKEIDRNNAIYAAQNNRNPFIDIPQFADCIWLGNCTGLSTPDVAMVNAGIRCFPTNATTDITIDWAQLSPDEVLAIDVHNMQGQLIYHKDISVQQNRNEQLSVSEWQRGIYTLRVNTRHGTQVRKIVLQ